MKLSLISHFHNEEMLLPGFISHHRDIFDQAVLINHASTDGSLKIIERLAPKTWQVVDSKLDDFDAEGTDREVMEIENELDGWKIALNVTEWIWNARFRDYIQDFERNHPDLPAFGMRSVVLVDPCEMKLGGKPLWLGRHYGFFSQPDLYVKVQKGLVVDRDLALSRSWRYCHRSRNGCYEIGRHATALPHLNDPDNLLLWWGFAPWPQSIPRKLQIQKRIPESLLRIGGARQHVQTPASLDEMYRRQLELTVDLLSEPAFKKQYDEFVRLYKESSSLPRRIQALLRKAGAAALNIARPRGS